MQQIAVAVATQNLLRMELLVNLKDVVEVLRATSLSLPIHVSVLVVLLVLLQLVVQVIPVVEQTNVMEIVTVIRIPTTPVVHQVVQTVPNIVVRTTVNTLVI